MKNVIIALQTIVICFGVLWGINYKHRTEQLFYVNNLRIMAADVALLTEIRHRIAGGETAKLQKDIAANVSGIIAEMEEHVTEQVDPTMEDTFATARGAGASLDSIGIHQVTAALNRRAASPK